MEENQDRKLKQETVIRLLRGEAIVGVIVALVGLVLYLVKIENMRLVFFLMVFGVFCVISGLSGVRSARKFYDNHNNPSR